MDLFIQSSQQFLADAMSQNPLVTMLQIILNGGWIIFIIIGFWSLLQWWKSYIAHQAAHHKKYIFLAIDIPKENLQTPKAVEFVFAQLHGVLSGMNKYQKYISGKSQDYFSCEIVSIGGNVQFVIRTNVVFRDLVEAAVYAQYPEAEITEVNDYTLAIPSTFPNPDWSMWGSEFVLARPNPYPIRTYINFEHTLSGEFLDPMAALLETMAKLQPEEQIWVQWIVTPIKDDWKEESDHLAKKIVGVHVKKEASFLDKAIVLPIALIDKVVDAVLPFIFPTGEEEEHKGGKPEAPSMIQYLSPGEKFVLDGVQSKMTKIGYRVKLRVVYVAPPDIYSKGRGVAPVVGAIKQFNTLDLNGFKGAKSTTTDVDYFAKWRTPGRQQRMMKLYRTRDNHGGADHGFILNVEELATVYHFPVSSVKAPLVKKVDAKRGGPPSNLPTLRTRDRAAAAAASSHDDHAGGHGDGHGGGGSHDVPDNLPIVH